MDPDIVIIGSGPNGLAAGIALQAEGFKVQILEAKDSIGGGTRTTELTLPGFHHDFCSAVHPAGYLSPFLRTLPLDKHGLEWIFPAASVAHPLDGQPAVMLYKSIERTMENLHASDAIAWRKMVLPFVSNPDDFLNDAMAPLQFPRNPFLLARFGLSARRAAKAFADATFKDCRARALFAGCAGHGILPFEWQFSAAFGMIFSVMGHLVDWPVPKGGSLAITRAMANYFTSLGGELTTMHPVASMADLPDASYYLFDTDPVQLADIAGESLPASYRKRLKNYRYGPGAFKIDFALDGPIPWRDATCLEASTVHVGGTLQEIADHERSVWEGRYTEKPFLILCQQSQFDEGRAPAGKHTGYAYCHVPNGGSRDMTDAIENQIERFAPGFKDRILAKHTTNTNEFYQYNRNYLGGAITGGAADITQLFTRPVVSLKPYTTPNRKIYMCSASTPPGGGVHGLCGWYAAKALLKKIKRN